MAEINFLPVCSNCRAILDDREIDVSHDENESIAFIKKHNKIELLPQRIIPNICPNCHELIECITIPTKLPFIIKKGDPSIDQY